MPLRKPTFNCSTETCRKASEHEIKTDENDEDTFKNENISNSGYNRTASAATESLYSTAFKIERNPTFKMWKKLSLKNSDMQKVKMYVLRVMIVDSKNEEGKKYGQKKNTTPPEHADRG